MLFFIIHCNLNQQNFYLVPSLFHLFYILNVYQRIPNPSKSGFLSSYLVHRFIKICILLSLMSIIFHKYSIPLRKILFGNVLVFCSLTMSSFFVFYEHNFHKLGRPTRKYNQLQLTKPETHQ